MSQDEIAQRLNGTAHAAFLKDLRVGRKIVSVMNAETNVRADSRAGRERRARFGDFLRQRMSCGRGLDEESLYELLVRIRTPESFALLEDWRLGRFEIRFLLGDDFDRAVASWGGARNCTVSFYKEGPRRPGLYLRTMERIDGQTVESRKAFAREFLERFLAVFHEWEHARHFSGPEAIRIGPFSRHGRYVSEILAYLEEYRAAIGILDFSDLEEARKEGLTLAQLFHLRAHRDYFAWRVSERLKSFLRSGAA